MSQGQSPAQTDLIDSLLHQDKTRVVKGILAGLAAGLLMLAVTTLFAPEGAGKLWWLQLAASALYGGDATRYEGVGSILVVGFIVHCAMSGLLGLIYGKITQSVGLGRLLAYGLVLGGLCWLGSNMFAVDILSISALGVVGQWLRMLLFQVFGLSLAFFVFVLVKK